MSYNLEYAFSKYILRNFRCSIKVQMMMFWDMKQCSSVDSYWHFTGTYKSAAPWEWQQVIPLKLHHITVELHMNYCKNLKLHLLTWSAVCLIARQSWFLSHISKYVMCWLKSCTGYISQMCFTHYCTMLTTTWIILPAPTCIQVTGTQWSVFVRCWITK